MFELWDGWGKECLNYEMVEVKNVWIMRWSRYRMFELWDGWGIKCLNYGIFWLQDACVLVLSSSIDDFSPHNFLTEEHVLFLFSHALCIAFTKPKYQDNYASLYSSDKSKMDKIFVRAVKSITTQNVERTP